MMTLKDAKAKYGISSTYYYKLLKKSNNDEKEFTKLLDEYLARKNERNAKNAK